MIKRTIEEVVRKSLRTFPVTALVGARQVGKSTLSDYIGKDLGFTYVSLDDLTLRAEANADPKFFLSRFPAPLVIDEAQKAAPLFDEIARIVNEVRRNGRSANGMYLLTGSESDDLKGRIQESLAGRANHIDMYSLSYDEINGRPEKPLSYHAEDYYPFESTDSVDDVFRRIVTGGYPELFVNAELEHQDFYAAYLKTYIERDVRKMIKDANEMKFIQFMQYCASLTGQELDKTKISKAIGIEMKTVDAWLSILAKTNIVCLLQPYIDSSLTKRIVRTPKLHFRDTGLACYLARLGDPKNLSLSYFAGAFFETYCVNEIIKGFNNHGRKAEFYYYRDNHQNEIDLVILENGELHPVEIKTTMNPSSSDVKAFAQLEGSAYEMGVGYLVCMANRLSKLKENAFALPISAI